MHLRQAAEHLVAAGKIELAQQVENEAILEEKLAEIRRLKAEVEELRGKASTDQTTCAGQTLTLDVKLMELQLSKLHKLGFDYQTAEGFDSDQITGSTGVQLVETQQAIDGLISGLREQGLVSTLR